MTDRILALVDGSDRVEAGEPMSAARSDRRPDASGAPQGSMRRYVLALAAGGLLVLALTGATLGILEGGGAATGTCIPLGRVEPQLYEADLQPSTGFVDGPGAPPAMPRPRVFISTDLLLSSEEKDDAQSLIHALMYQDRMNIVGIAASPSKWGHQDGRVGDIDRIIDAYGRDHAMLRAQSAGFKTAAELKAISWQGATDVAPSSGHSKATDASCAIIAEAKAAAAAGEKLNVLTWGGETDLAQALHDDPSIARHIRFFSIDDQDVAAYAYLKANFKGSLDMWVDNLSTFRGTSTSPGGLGGTKDIIRGWHDEHAEGHGALGDFFADVSGDIFDEEGVKMGDSPTVFRFLSGDQNDPTQESWGGEFVQRPSGGPGRYYTDNPDDALDFNRLDTDGAMTVYEDRAVWMADFAERFDWLEGDDDD